MLIKVLIIEDSVFQRSLLSEMLSSHKNIEINAISKNIENVFDKLDNFLPDIIILDIETISTHELSIFNKIIGKTSLPTIILTSSNQNQLEPSFKKIISKAFDIIIKPYGIWKYELPKIKDLLIKKVLSASKNNQKRIHNRITLLEKKLFVKKAQEQKRIKEDNLVQKKNSKYEEFFFDKSPVHIDKLETNIIVMGASVGGPKTFRQILKEIPKNFPSPILIVQHMNNFFTRQFALQLKDICNLDTRLGKNGDDIIPGVIYIAQGDKHMQIIETKGKPCIRIYEGESVNFCRPSVDVLFYSAARVYKNHVLGILLTGMGIYGLEGLRAIKQFGGKTVSESQETAILYGMPKMAALSGVADLIIPNYKIKDIMINFAKRLN